MVVISRFEAGIHVFNFERSGDPSPLSVARRWFSLQHRYFDYAAARYDHTGGTVPGSAWRATHPLAKTENPVRKSKNPF